MKIVIIVALIAVVAALGLAGRAMLQDGRNGAPKSNRMVRALAWRVVAHKPAAPQKGWNLNSTGLPANAAAVPAAAGVHTQPAAPHPSVP